MPFIVIEGPNGAGKSTLAAELVELLAARGGVVHITQEPTKTAFGMAVRTSESYLSGRSLGLAVAADRCAHVESVILPALRRGETVVCDRYVASSLALQSLDGMVLDEIFQMNGGLPIPDVTYFLAVSSETLTRRLAQRDSHSRFEATKSRNAELTAFKNAYDYLKLKGWNQHWIESGNDSKEALASRCLDLFDQC